MKLTHSLALGACLTLLLSAAPAHAQGKIFQKVKKIQDEISKMRGLEFQAPVKAGVYTPEQLLEMLKSSFDDEGSPEDMANEEEVYKLFGLLPKDYDLRGELLKFMGENIQGFYRPDKKELFLIDRKLGGFEQQQMETMAMAHELHHALQDQNFGIDRWGEALQGRSDRYRGFQGLVEGEAQLIGMKYLFKKMGQPNVDLKSMNEMQDRMMAMDPRGAKLLKIPAILREGMMFPYTQGGEFVQELRRKKGWKGISAAWADPPTSTEQILHPEKYYGPNRDEPQEIALSAGIHIALGGEKKAKEMIEDTHGEFQCSLILREHGMKKKAANKAAEGWDGDRFVAYRVGERVVIVWVSTWDTEEHAKTWTAAYAAGLKRKGVKAHLERRGTEVVWIYGSEGDELKLLTTKAFRSLRYTMTYRPSAEILDKPTRDEFPGAGGSSHEGHEHAKPTTPVRPTTPTTPTKPEAATGEGGRFVRLDDEGATFRLPEGFAAKDDPAADLAEVSRAFYQSETQQLRALDLPFPIKGGKERLERAIKNRGGTLEKSVEAESAAGKPYLLMQSTGNDGKLDYRSLMVMIPNGPSRTLGLMVSQKKADSTEALETTIRAILSTLWLDHFGNDEREVAIQKVVHENHRVFVPQVLPKQLAGDPAYGRIHRQEDVDGAQISISARATKSTLKKIAERTERMLGLAHAAGVKVIAAGVVGIGERDVFELEYEKDGRRVRQRTFLVGGQRWTITCSAKSDDFSSYRAKFGDALNAFNVKKAGKRKVY